jgi:hypothetical protein
MVDLLTDGLLLSNSIIHIIMETSNAAIGLATALGLDPTMAVATHAHMPAISPPIASGDQTTADAEYARTNIIDIIQKGSESLDQAMELARESQHPRMYEVLGQILKVQSDNIDKLLKLHADLKKLTSNEENMAIANKQNNQQPINVDQAIIFQGTSDELIRMVRGEQKKNIIDVDIEKE